MPKMHLIQSEFTYSSSESFTKNKERIEKFKETGNSWFIYQRELDKSSFQHEIAYRGFKILKCFINFLIKKLQAEELKMGICQTKN